MGKQVVQEEMAWREHRRPRVGRIVRWVGEGEGSAGTPRTEEINKGSATTEVEGNAAGNQPPQTFHCEAKL